MGFCCNALAKTAMAPVMKLCDHTWKCVHRRAKLRKWMDNERMHATTVEAPAVFTGDIHYMSFVDRFDQLRAAHKTDRKERCITMSIFRFLLDARVINAYALYSTLEGGADKRLMTLQEFKRQVA